MTSIANIVSGYGSTVQILSVTQVLDKRGYSATETISTAYGSSAVVQVMDGSEEEVTEGLLNIGDIQAFFDPNDSNIANVIIGNRIIYQTINYEIVNVIKEQTGGTEHFREVHGKRIG